MLYGPSIYFLCSENLDLDFYEGLLAEFTFKSILKQAVVESVLHLLK